MLTKLHVEMLQEIERLKAAQPEPVQNVVDNEAKSEAKPAETRADTGVERGGQLAPVQEPVVMESGKRLIVVDQSFDELMYWLDRCEDKGHLENCPDLVEPWSAFQYENYTTPPAPQPVPVKTYHDGKPWPVQPAPNMTHASDEWALTNQILRGDV
jgi:hypothetical protein